MGLDLQQRALIVQAELPTICVGRGEEFELIRLDLDRPGDPTPTLIKDRGLSFVAIFGLVDGMPVARLNPANPEAAYTAVFAGLKFVHMAAPYLRAAAKPNDFVHWAEGLQALPDDRN